MVRIALFVLIVLMSEFAYAQQPNSLPPGINPFKLVEVIASQREEQANKSAVLELRLKESEDRLLLATSKIKELQDKINLLDINKQKD